MPAGKGVGGGELPGAVEEDADSARFRRNTHTASVLAEWSGCRYCWPGEVLTQA